jgi:transporter family-2 protein
VTVALTWLAAAWAAGALIALQGPVLAKVASYAGGPLQAAMFAFLVGSAALAAILLSTGQRLPDVAGLLRMPTWAWSGGLIGATMIMVTLGAVPRVGVAAFVAAAVSGQLIAGLVVDRVGMSSLQPVQIGAKEALGALFVVSGALLIGSR